MAEAAHLREIAQRLRLLQTNSPIHGDDLDRWYAEAREFTDWQPTRFPEVKLPPQVMFYLHDADSGLKMASIERLRIGPWMKLSPVLNADSFRRQPA